MKEYRIFYLLLVVVSLAMSVVYRGMLTMFIIMILLLVPLFSFLLYLIGFFLLKVEIKEERQILKKKEHSSISITLRNRFIMPISSVQLHGRFQAQNEQEITEKTILVDIAPFSTTSFDIPVCLQYRGFYQMGVQSLSLLDLLGVFRLRRKLALQTEFIVVPREFDLGKLKDKSEDDLDSTQSAVSLINHSVFSALREYHSGDSLKQIHWKLSAKQDDLISKELEQPLDNSTVIFADFTHTFLQLELSHLLTDAIIETLLAINKEAIKGNSFVLNCWQDVRSERCEGVEVTNEDSYVNLYYAMAMLPTVPFDAEFLELVSIYWEQAHSGKSVYFIIPILDEDFVSMYQSSGLSKKDNITILYFNTLHSDPTLLQQFGRETKAEIIQLDPENIIESF